MTPELVLAFCLGSAFGVFVGVGLTLCVQKLTQAHGWLGRNISPELALPLTGGQAGHPQPEALPFLLGAEQVHAPEVDSATAGGKTSESKPSFKEALASKAQASLNINLIGVGDECGLFDSLLKGGAMSSEMLAQHAGCHPRYVKEWCLAMAANDVLAYSAQDKTFYLTEEVKEVVSDPSGLALAFIIPAIIGNRDKIARVFKTGGGIGWDEHDERLYAGTCRFFKPVYDNHLVECVPAALKAKLEAGGSLADVGCGYGASAIILAKAFPNAKIVGYDFHAPSIEIANKKKAEAGLTNVFFEVRSATDFGSPAEFDGICFLDCFHDMNVAALAAKRAGVAIKPGGICFLIELMAAETDDVTEQMALPSCGMYAGLSCHICLPCSMMQNEEAPGDALGTVVPTERHRKYFCEGGGFSSLSSMPSPVNDMGFRFIVAEK